MQGADSSPVQATDYMLIGTKGPSKQREGQGIVHYDDRYVQDSEVSKRGFASTLRLGRCLAHKSNVKAIASRTFPRGKSREHVLYIRSFQTELCAINTLCYKLLVNSINMYKAPAYKTCYNACIVLNASQT